MSETTPPALPTIAANQLAKYGVSTVVVTVVFSTLATLAVIGRFWSRYLNAFTPVFEDWLLVGGLYLRWDMRLET